MTTYEKFKASAICCLCLFLICASFACLQARELMIAGWSGIPAKITATLDSLSGIGPAISSVSTQANTTIAGVGGQAQRVLSKTADSVDHVNAPCAPGPCGTLADVAKTLNTFRMTSGQLEIAANHEDQNLGTLDAQENQLFDDLHGTAMRLNSNLDTTQLTFAHVDGLITSPILTKMANDWADTSHQVDGIAVDAHKEADALVAPKPWWQKLGNAGTTGVNVACLITHSCPF